MAIGALKKLGEPALGAVPIAPYPINNPMRWALVLTFLVYANMGQARDAHTLVLVAEVALAGAMVAVEAGFFCCRRNPAALLRLWSLVLIADVVVIVTASAADGAEQSPIPLLTVATIFTAAAMFRWPYVALLTAFAAVSSVGTHILVEALTGSQMTLAPSAFASIAILGSGGFAIVRGRAEERLRHSLIAAEAREREQSESLRLAFESSQESQARFQAFSDHAPAILMLFDSGRQQVFASRYAHDAFGISPDSPAGTGNFWTRVTPREGQRGQAALDSALAGKPAFAAFSARNAAGEERQLEGTFFGIGDGAGAIMRDVTVERELAAQVSRARQVETLGTLAGGVAHDFNNLLTAILGNIYLARETLAENSDAVSLLDDAKTAGERGAELVRRLLDYGRPAVEHNELIPLGKLVSETIALASPGLTPKIELVTDAETCAERRVTGDFAALQQVLLNLLVNARDAMSEGGRICITVTECHPDVGVAAARRYGIAVSDTGCGIAPDIIGRIFDPFFTTKGIGKGTGLGLATAMSIMRAHGGTILVESSPEAGSTFRMILPAGEPVEAAA